MGCPDVMTVKLEEHPQIHLSMFFKLFTAITDMI